MSGVRCHRQLRPAVHAARAAGLTAGTFGRRRRGLLLRCPHCAATTAVAAWPRRVGWAASRLLAFLAAHTGCHDPREAP